MTTNGPPRTAFVSANGLLMHYLDWGGDGPMVVLAHAAGFCASVWAPIAKSLSCDYRVLSVDLRGHGDTAEAPDGDYSWQAIGRDMAAFLEALDIRDAMAIGHSYGGAALLLGGALVPGRIRCAVHMEPAMVLHLGDRAHPREQSNGSSRLARARRRRIVWDSRQQIFDAYKKKLLMSTWREDFIWAYIEGAFRVSEDGSMVLKKPPEVDVQIYSMAKPYPELWDELSTYKTPALIVMGSANPLVQQDSDEVRRLLDVTQDTRMLWVTGANHFMPMEQPKDFEDIVRRFAQEVEAG